VFELLGISLLLAGLLTFNSIASLVTAGAWRVCRRFTTGRPAQVRARFIFFVRTIPALLAILCVSFLLIPAYLAFEPRHTTEAISFKLGLLALLSAITIGFALVRSIAAWRATKTLKTDWLQKAEPVVLNGVNIQTFRIEHAFPVIAIIGVFKPRLFIASQVFSILSTDEIAAAVAHENGHIDARDNLKRGLMRACRDALLIFPAGRWLDSDWAEAAEEAADEYAAQRGYGVALDLASALVKIARSIPKGARPTMPAGVFLIGDTDTEANGIRWRVKRLVEIAQVGLPHQERRPTLWNLMIWGVLASSIIIGGCFFHIQTILVSVHVLIEQAVQFLR